MTLEDVEHMGQLGTDCIATIGMFDGVHRGHRVVLGTLLTEAERRGLQPVVITFDRHPRHVIEGNTSQLCLLSTLEERLALIEQCGVHRVAMVHFTRELAALSACEFCRRFLSQGVRALLLGYDNMFGSKQHNDFEALPDLARTMRMELLRAAPLVVDGLEVSSTRVRKALQQGDVEEAERLLGRPYRLSGTVVHGREVGRRMGFPTANVAISGDHMQLPAAGAYVVGVRLNGGEPLVGMAHLGTLPTFDIDSFGFEIHLLDYDADLYGQQLQVDFLHRLRPVQRFDSERELHAQLQQDVAQTRALAARREGGVLLH